MVLDAGNPQAPLYRADSSTVITGDLVKQYDLAHPPKAGADGKNSKTRHRRQFGVDSAPHQN
ncbi:MAG TPA: hypothetical protein VKJ01_20360 [Candidatus Solibacter sp.]|nr:hypothetical protein [Candidatus Solibacter sp.]